MGCTLAHHHVQVGGGEQCSDMIEIPMLNNRCRPVVTRWHKLLMQVVHERRHVVVVQTHEQAIGLSDQLLDVGDTQGAVLPCSRHHATVSSETHNRTALG